MESISPNQFSEEKDLLPIYNIKAVSSMLDLLPVTLRAWERRYGMPSPSRGLQGYRLYSEYDVRLLRWLKRQNDAGMSIGQAVKYLTELRNTGKDPAQDYIEENKLANITKSPFSLESLANHFYHHLSLFQDEAATDTLRRAFSLYNVDQVLNQVVEPALVEMGEAWHRGDLPIAVEHFATQFCIQHLMGMLASSSQPTREGTILAACAPGEMHQVGLLNLVVILRWRGWNVKYFGQDLSLERLVETLTVLKPDMLLFSATRRESALALSHLKEVLNDYPFEKPLIILGGQAFDDQSLGADIPGEIIQLPPSEAVEQIEKRIYRRAAHKS
jgi:DNA-binding transcriptional MerR regulator